MRRIMTCAFAAILSMGLVGCETETDDIEPAAQPGMGTELGDPALSPEAGSGVETTPGAETPGAETDPGDIPAGGTDVVPESTE